MQSKLVFALMMIVALLVGDQSMVFARDAIFCEQNYVLMSCQEDCAQGNIAGGSTAQGGNCGGPLPDTIPEYWRTLIDEAAAKHPDADRRLVAATLWIENRGWPDPNKNWATSSAGAQGPWQFIPSSWASMGEDGDGDGVKDPNNPKDAVHAAFNHVKGSACKPILEGATGNAEADYNNIPFKRDGNNTLTSALANYNGSGTRDGVPLAKQGRGQNPDYVRMGYWLIASNFKQTVNIDEGSGELKDISQDTAPGADVAASTTGSGATTDNSGCPGGTSQNGAATVVKIGDHNYAFPVILPKDDVTNGVAWPCPGICHHDGTPAFDLSRNAQDDSSEGVPVVAITDGTIDRFNNSYSGVSGCQSFQLRGNDGYSYWYGHIQSSSVQDGATVTAGQQISVIGRRDCTGNGSYPHLHIDRGTKGTSGGSVGNRDGGMVPLINDLYERLGGGTSGGDINV